MFRQVTRREFLVILPQPLADLADRRPRQQQPPALVLEGVLDVANGKPAGQHLDSQVLQRLTVALQVVAQLGAERFLRTGDLRSGIFDEALRVFRRPGR